VFRRTTPLATDSGTDVSKSIVEIMFALAIVGMLASIGMGKNLFGVLMPNNRSVPSEQWNMLAERMANGTMCFLVDYDVPLTKCVDFGKTTCPAAAKKVALDCLLEHRHGVPSLLTGQEETLLADLASPCIQRTWLPSLVEKFEIDTRDRVCDRIFNPAHREPAKARPRRRR
jgi:hypothetical protein